MKRFERFGFAALLAIFASFTWRGLTMFYSGDDMMNMDFAWTEDPWRLAAAQLGWWIPVYRPVGGGIYRLFYAIFGFHPEPLYVFCWLLLLANVGLGYRFFRAMTGSVPQALIATSLTLVHGMFSDLYLSAGTIYDRLCYLFTALGLTVWASGPASWGRFGLVCLISILAMGSKESGVALPVLIVIYELVYRFESWRGKAGLMRAGFIRAALQAAGLAGICLVFVFLRVHRTWALNAFPAYQPHADLPLWLRNVSEYFRILLYRHHPIAPWVTGLVVVALGLLALALRNRAMIFGWVFFMLTITPVALIPARPGYVLYVPIVGLGLYFAAAISGLARRVPGGEYAAFALLTVALTWEHYRHWPAAWDMNLSPERRFTLQFRKEYPTMPRGAKLLFVSDDFPPPAFDLAFNAALLYNDKTLLVRRMAGPPDQQPDPKEKIKWDHVFRLQDARYVELDNRDVAESLRLNILRGVAVGQEMDFRRKDYAGYLVSGVKGGDPETPNRWTDARAKLKFVVSGATQFSTRYFVPGFVVGTKKSVLSVVINGRELRRVELDSEGMQEVSTPLPAGLVTGGGGFTVVELNVENPWKDAGGQEFGVVLERAGFR